MHHNTTNACTHHQTKDNDSHHHQSIWVCKSFLKLSQTSNIEKVWQSSYLWSSIQDQDLGVQEEDQDHDVQEQEQDQSVSWCSRWMAVEHAELCTNKVSCSSALRQLPMQLILEIGMHNKVRSRVCSWIWVVYELTANSLVMIFSTSPLDVQDQ